MITKARLLLLLAIGALTISGCRPEDAGHTDILPEQGVAIEPGQYYHLEGLLGTDSIVFELLSERSLYDQQTAVRGYYYYVREGQPRAVLGSPDSTGLLQLTEAHMLNDSPPSIQGRFLEDGSFMGIWSTADNQRPKPLRLSPRTGAVALETFEKLDSFLLSTSKPASPKAQIRFSWLEAKGNESETVNFINKAIFAALLSDSLARISPAPAAGLEAAKTAFFDLFKQEVGGMMTEGIISSDEEMSAFSYQQEQGVNVYFNQHDLLTLGFSTYTYSGGAHGMHSTLIRSYDIKNKKVYRLDDVLRPDSHAQLSLALARAARIRFGMREEQSLSEYLFEDNIEPNSNFGLTDKGIFFVYAPYEIAAYAFGEIELFVPFADIRPLLTASFAASL
jgi:hypothetical protein